MDWYSLVAGGAISMVVWWLTQGIAGWWKTRQARRADLAKDERQAAADEEADLRSELQDERQRRRIAEARVDVLDDYAHGLREDYSNATGKAPRPWPPLS